jgi:hypothetical protein
MDEFKFEVVETRTVQCTYAVEANSLEEAREMAGIGDTTMEEPHDHTMEVINREIVR